jgi:hypothetical protein
VFNPAGVGNNGIPARAHVVMEACSAEVAAIHRPSLAAMPCRLLWIVELLTVPCRDALL